MADPRIETCSKCGGECKWIRRLGWARVVCCKCCRESKASRGTVADAIAAHNRVSRAARGEKAS